MEHKTGMHCETPTRLRIAMEAVQGFGLLKSGGCQIFDPRMGSTEEIGLVHDPSYVEEIKRFCAAGGGHYDGDTPLSPDSFDVACLAVGGIIDACKAVFEGKVVNAYGLVRPPGHHAGVDGRAMGASTNGFCVFNNVAVAAAYALKKRWAERVLILDVDGHHGNGTQEAFNNTSNVLYASLHEKGIYPGTGYVDEVGEGEGAGYKINIPLAHGTTDAAPLKALDEVILPVAEQFKPDLVLISAGFDAHHSDPITSLSFSNAAFIQMFKSMLNLAKKHCKDRVVACLEGGYSEEALSTALPLSIAAMAEIPLTIPDAKLASREDALSRSFKTIQEGKKILGKYWAI